MLKQVLITTLITVDPAVFRSLIVERQLTRLLFYCGNSCW